MEEPNIYGIKWEPPDKPRVVWIRLRSLSVDFEAWHPFDVSGIPDGLSHGCDLSFQNPNRKMIDKT